MRAWTLNFFSPGRRKITGIHYAFQWITVDPEHASTYRHAIVHGWVSCSLHLDCNIMPSDNNELDTMKCMHSCSLLENIYVYVWVCVRVCIATFWYSIVWKLTSTGLVKTTKAEIQTNVIFFILYTLTCIFFSWLDLNILWSSLITFSRNK